MGSFLLFKKTHYSIWILRTTICMLTHCIFFLPQVHVSFLPQVHAFYIHSRVSSCRPELSYLKKCIPDPSPNIYRIRHQIYSWTVNLSDRVDILFLSYHNINEIHILFFSYHNINEIHQSSKTDLPVMCDSHIVHDFRLGLLCNASIEHYQSIFSAIAKLPLPLIWRFREIKKENWKKTFRTQNLWICLFFSNKILFF